MKKVSENISDFLNFLDSAEHTYCFSAEQMNNMDAMTQDILHCMELRNINSKDRNKLATKLAHVRKARRTYKNEVEIFGCIVRYKTENKAAIDKLRQCLGEVRKMEKYHKYGVYQPKVLNCAEIIGKKEV